MLVRFSVANFLSFREVVEFSAIATPEQQHSARIGQLPAYEIRLLPIAAIFGANGAGKSNFVKALSFAQDLVARGTKPDQLLPVRPFRLDDTCSHRPAEFRFELLIGESIFEYRFAVTNGKIISESLKEFVRTREKKHFERKESDSFEGSFDLGFYQKNLADVDFQFLQFVARGTRANQLFITECAERNVSHFQPIYRWFRETLKLITPETVSHGLEFTILDREEVREFANSILPRIDTGVARLDSEEVQFDSLGFPEPLRQHVISLAQKGHDTMVLMQAPGGSRYSVRFERGEIRARKLVTWHRTADGQGQRKFDLSEESSGTQRVIDLLPAFDELTKATHPKVFVVDEIDRSLHPNLTRELVQAYLAACGSEPRSQLLMTTHDALLLDQNLLRRDETWFIEKDETGASRLMALSDYRGVRKDTDIQKRYLSGRFGGVPRLMPLPRAKRTPAVSRGR